MDWLIAALDPYSDGSPFSLQQKHPAYKTFKASGHGSSHRQVPPPTQVGWVYLCLGRKKLLWLKPLPRDTERSGKGEEQLRSQARG